MFLLDYFEIYFTPAHISKSHAGLCLSFWFYYYFFLKFWCKYDGYIQPYYCSKYLCLIWWVHGHMRSWTIAHITDALHTEMGSYPLASLSQVRAVLTTCLLQNSVKCVYTHWNTYCQTISNQTITKRDPTTSDKFHFLKLHYQLRWEWPVEVDLQCQATGDPFLKSRHIGLVNIFFSFVLPCKNKITQTSLGDCTFSPWS